MQRVKQIPFKRADTRVVSYLVPAEMDALLGAACVVDSPLAPLDFARG